MEESDKDLGKAIERVFNETNDLNEIQSRVILLVKDHAKAKQDNSPDASKVTGIEKQIERDIKKFSRRIFKNIEKDINSTKDALGQKDKTNLLDAKSRENLKRVMKNFAVYDVYKVMNPRKIAGETKKDNYEHNLTLGGEKLASKYEGGKESDLKKYGAKEVERIKKKALSINKNRGMSL